jgi:hypothetical protein
VLQTVVVEAEPRWAGAEEEERHHWVVVGEEMLVREVQAIPGIGLVVVHSIADTWQRN